MISAVRGDRFLRGQMRLEPQLEIIPAILEILSYTLKTILYVPFS